MAKQTRGYWTWREVLDTDKRLNGYLFVIAVMR